MPTKTTPKTSARKTDDTRRGGKPAITSRTATKTAPVEKPKGATAEPPAAPKAPKEVVSLIEPKQKTVRKRTPSPLENKPFATLPSISRILEPEPPKTAVAAPPEVPPASPEALLAGDEGGEKIVHLKPPFSVKDLADAMGLKP
ncbi:MAG TPA: translation initiation factor IF-2, partial [Chthoniobacteraceae bacterium]|nr:translation initiation factor IF-2 [Chthoniobacteraceae bacterium]